MLLHVCTRIVIPDHDSTIATNSAQTEALSVKITKLGHPEKYFCRTEVTSPVTKFSTLHTAKASLQETATGL